MPEFSFRKAVKGNILNDTDQKRLTCIMVHLMANPDFKKTLNGLVNWDNCAKDFGAATGGFKKMFDTSTEKLRDAECFFDADEANTAAAGPAGAQDNETAATTDSVPATPKGMKTAPAGTNTKTQAKPTPRKRKVAAVATESAASADTATAAAGAADDAAAEVKTPVKKRARTTKTKETPTTAKRGRASKKDTEAARLAKEAVDRAVAAITNSRGGYLAQYAQRTKRGRAGKKAADRVKTEEKA